MRVARGPYASGPQTCTRQKNECKKINVYYLFIINIIYIHFYINTRGLYVHNNSDTQPLPPAHHNVNGGLGADHLNHLQDVVGGVLGLTGPPGGAAVGAGAPVVAHHVGGQARSGPG